MNYISPHDFYLETNGKLIDIDGMYGGQCFTKGHLITMTDGRYKKIEEIKSGDYVYNKDMTKKNKVIAVLKRKANVISLKTTESNFICTKEHPFYDGKSFVIASDISINDNLYFPTRQQEKVFDLTDNELKWLGFWLGDGHIIRYENRTNSHGRKNNYAVTISGDKKKFVKDLNIKMNVSKHSSHKDTVIGELNRKEHYELYKALRLCHNSDGLKTLPMVFTKEQYMKIFNGYYNADGDKKRKTVTSTSLELLLGIQYGLKLNNIQSSVRIKRKAKNMEVFGKKIKSKELYMLSISKRRFLKVEELENDVVYNLMVDGDNTYICNNIAVHNCWDLFAYFTKKVWNRTFSCIKTGYVIDFWNAFDEIGLGEFFEKVTGNYQDGDWLIWKAPATITTSSHIAMFRIDNGDGTNVILTQNPNGNPNVTHQMVCDYKGVVGALRPKIYISQAPVEEIKPPIKEDIKQPVEEIVTPVEEVIVEEKIYIRIFKAIVKFLIGLFRK